MGLRETELIERLRGMLARGVSLRAAAVALGVGKDRLHRLAGRHGLYGGISRQGRKLSREIDRRIRRRLAAGEAVRAIARSEGITPHAVRCRREVLAVAQALREKLAVRHRPTSPWRCPACGSLVSTDPSVCHGVARPRSAPRRTNDRPQQHS